MATDSFKVDLCYSVLGHEYDLIVVSLNDFIVLLKTRVCSFIYHVGNQNLIYWFVCTLCTCRVR